MAIFWLWDFFRFHTVLKHIEGFRQDEKGKLTIGKVYGQSDIHIIICFMKNLILQLFEGIHIHIIHRSNQTR